MARKTKTRKAAVNLFDVDIGFDLQRLFDPYNLDHVPEGKRLALFETRDLQRTKKCMASMKVLGMPSSRKRIIIAPSMETPQKHRLGLYFRKKVLPAPPVINSEIMPSTTELKSQSLSVVDERENRLKNEEVTKLSDYQQWIQNRKKLRSGLENMGLNEEYLQRKPDRTTLENRVLKKLVEVKKWKPPASMTIVKKQDAADRDDPVPLVKMPTPLALQMLDRFLKQNKLRLVDLYSTIDKDKNWKVTKSEFKCALRNVKLDISQQALDDLVLALDNDMTDTLDFHELMRGMKQWHHERRENKQKAMSSMDNSRAGSANNHTISSTSPTSTPSTATPDYKTQSRPSSCRKTSLTGKPISAGVSREMSRLGSLHSKTLTMQSINDIGATNDTISTSSFNKLQAPKVMSRLSATDSSGPNGVSFSGELAASSMPREVSISSAGGGTQTLGGDESAVKSIPQISVTSSSSTNCTRQGSAPYLELPDMDLRSEQYVLSSDEAMVDLRKRCRSLLARTGTRSWPTNFDGDHTTIGVIATGDEAIDRHCHVSQMGGDVAPMIDQFRQDKLREYYDILQLCLHKNVPLSRCLLERVLLYPPDRPHSAIRGKIQQPGIGLMSASFADPPKRPPTPIEIKHKDKVKRSKSGTLMIDSRHVYPPQRKVVTKPVKMNLSSGRALVGRQVDCWMTFEEYDKLTRHLAVRYQLLHSHVDYNAFWPGHLLEKVRLCMPPYDQVPHADNLSAMFTKVSPEKTIYPSFNSLKT